MLCPKCNALNADTARKCAKCGELLIPYSVDETPKSQRVTVKVSAKSYTMFQRIMYLGWKTIFPKYSLYFYVDDMGYKVTSGQQPISFMITPGVHNIEITNKKKNQLLKEIGSTVGAVVAYTVRSVAWGQSETLGGLIAGETLADTLDGKKADGSMQIEFLPGQTVHFMIGPNFFGGLNIDDVTVE